VKKLSISLTTVLALAALLYLPAGADDDLTATITPLVLSVEVSPSSIAYGTLPLSNNDIDRRLAMSQTITADNLGSDAKFVIRGSDATTLTQDHANWTLDCSSDTTGIVGQDQFVHRFKVGSQPDFNQSGAHTLCSTANGGSKELSPNVISGTDVEFTLQLAMPIGSTGQSQRSTTVTVIAVAP
jgi:hypothetical protein